MNTAHPPLPPAQQKTLRRAIRIEWFTIGFLAVAITGVNLVMGSSQAMKPRGSKTCCLWHPRSLS